MLKGSENVAKHAEKCRGRSDKSQAAVRDHDAGVELRQAPSYSSASRDLLSSITDVPQSREPSTQLNSCNHRVTPSLGKPSNLLDPVQSQQGHRTDHVISFHLKASLPLEAGDFEDLCIICLDVRLQTVFYSCLHAVVCTTCVQRLQAATNECPICRSNLHSVQPLTG